MEARVIEQALGIEGDWQDDLRQHLDHGWVYSSPTAFGMARIVDRTWDDEDLMDCSQWLDPGDLTDPDLMWYYTRVAGNVAEVLSRLPFPLSWAGYHRIKGENTIVYRHDFARFCRLHRSHPVQVPHGREIGFHACLQRRG